VLTHRFELDLCRPSQFSRFGRATKQFHEFICLSGSYGRPSRHAPRERPAHSTRARLAHDASQPQLDTNSFKQEKVSFAASGLISGVLSTTTSLSGPPVVLLLVNQGWGKEALRATVSTYLLVSSAVGIGLLATVGAYVESVLSMGMGLVPAPLLGYLVGVKLLPKMRGETFRKIVTLVVVVAGLSAAVSGLWEVIASRLAS